MAGAVDDPITPKSDPKDQSVQLPDHTKLGADLSLMSFLKQGPIKRRGVVNAVNPMMPISTSDLGSGSLAAQCKSCLQLFRLF